MLRVFFWLADGTSKLNPEMFYQVYSIHVSVSGIYAFQLNKTEKTYDRFLQALIDWAPNCQPEKFLLHFEQAAF